MWYSVQITNCVIYFMLYKNSKCSDSNIIAGYSNAQQYLKFLNAMQTNWVTASRFYSIGSIFLLDYCFDTFCKD